MKNGVLAVVSNLAQDKRDVSVQFNLKSLGLEGRRISATDALVTLGAAIGTGMCMLCRCDVDNSGMTSATDALAILQASVGQPVTLNCPAC